MFVDGYQKVEMIWEFPVSVSLGAWPFCFNEGYGYMQFTAVDVTGVWKATSVPVSANDGDQYFVLNPPSGEGIAINDKIDITVTEFYGCVVSAYGQ